MREEIVRSELAAVFSAEELTTPRMSREHPERFVFGLYPMALLNGMRRRRLTISG